MPPQEQADLWMALRDRMKTNWAELTLQEKKAGTHTIQPPCSPPLPIEPALALAFAQPETSCLAPIHVNPSNPQLE